MTAASNFAGQLEGFQHALSLAHEELVTATAQLEDAKIAFNTAAAEDEVERALAADFCVKAPLVPESDIQLLEEVRAVCIGTPPTTTVVVLECAAGVLEAASNHTRSAAALVEGRARPECLKRVFMQDDVVHRMQGLDDEGAEALSAVVSLRPAIEARLTAAAITPDRALRCSASTAALLRWCQAAIKLSTVDTRERKPPDDRLALAEAQLEAASAAEEAAHRKVASAQAALEASLEASQSFQPESYMPTDVPSCQISMPEPPATNSEVKARVAPHSVPRSLAASPAAAKVSNATCSATPSLHANSAVAVEELPTVTQLSSSDEEEENVLAVDVEQPLAVLRQCVQFRRGDAEIPQDQRSLLRTAATVIQQHDDLEAAVVGVREEMEQPELELARAEAVRTMLTALGATCAVTRVRCWGGGAGPRGSRQADLRVLQRLKLPAPLEFDPGSDKVPRACRSAIRGIIQMLLTKPALRICLEGSQDADEEIGLGFRRAAAVRDKLLQRGVDDARTECSESRMSSGRRVEVRVLELPCSAFVKRCSDSGRF